MLIMDARPRMFGIGPWALSLMKGVVASFNWLVPPGGTKDRGVHLAGKPAGTETNGSSLH